MKRRTLNRVALATAFLALVYALYAVPFADKVAWLVAWAKANPVPGIAVYAACVAPAAIAFAPASAAMMIAGYLFGFWTGIVAALLGLVLGGQVSFLLGRFVARDWVVAKVGTGPRMTAIEAGLREEAFLIITLTRLVMPFSLLSYAFSITSVHGGVYFLATAIGMLLPAALYVYLGTVANDVGQILSGTATPDGVGYLVAAVGIAAIALLTWTMHRVAGRVLARHLPAMESDNVASAE